MTAPIPPVDDATLDELLAAARTAAHRAYVPYSKFRVGAAVLAADGTVVPGCNVENASYGLACCAERTALFSAVASGYREVVALAVTCADGDPTRPDTLMPCGACRQVMAELLPRDAPVIVDGVGRYTIDELLPRAFRL
ncbi:MAG TPA: cytidine deaminase [Acidimicrobiales bacterium]|nr:cytidine deaminase [Acidimicrobiales bacterium]